MLVSDIPCWFILYFVIMAQDAWAQCVVCGNTIGYMSYKRAAEP